MYMVSLKTTDQQSAVLKVIEIGEALGYTEDGDFDMVVITYGTLETDFSLITSSPTVYSDIADFLGE